MLLEGQAWRRAVVRLGGQAVGLLGLLEPAVHAGAIDTIDAGNHLGTFARVNRLHGPVSSTLQFHRGSKWSTHKELEARGSTNDSLTAQLAIITSSATKGTLAMRPQDSPFSSGWWGTSLANVGLEDSRPDVGTYGRYDFAQLPP